jgi:hypothetical protein
MIAHIYVHLCSLEATGFMIAFREVAVGLAFSPLL